MSSKSSTNANDHMSQAIRFVKVIRQHNADEAVRVSREIAAMDYAISTWPNHFPLTKYDLMMMRDDHRY